MRILVTGKHGQIDSALQQLGDSTPGIEIVRIGRPQVDLSQPETLEQPMYRIQPDVIISSAAYTGVDRAEGDAALAETVNCRAPGELARLASQLGIPLLHLSTDYVFSGDKDGPYIESDEPSPINVYGYTKLMGEIAIRQTMDNHVILRTSWVYSAFGNNFVKTMLKLAETQDEVSVVCDQQGCPTAASEIARALLTIARRVASDRDPSLRGVFHLAGLGDATWADFARAIFSGAEARRKKVPEVRDVRASAFPTVAKRPANSRLDGQKMLKTYDLRLSPWRESLDQCLDQLIGGIQT